MKWLSYPVTNIYATTKWQLTLIAILGLLSACGSQAKLESCKFVEIEEPEFEVEFGDVDVEGGEVEIQRQIYLLQSTRS